MRVTVFYSVVDADARYLFIKKKLGSELFKSKVGQGGVDVVSKIGMFCMDEVFDIFVFVKRDDLYVV